jgi:hypothetical protein
MATRRYSINPEDNDHAVTDAVGAATATKNIELTVDWDNLAALGLSGQHARLQVLTALERLHAYIETSGKFGVAA